MSSLERCPLFGVPFIERFLCNQHMMSRTEELPKMQELSLLKVTVKSPKHLNLFGNVRD